MASPEKNALILAGALAWVIASGPSCAAERVAGPIALEVRVAARAIAPGEPLRLEVTSADGLETLDATLLGNPVYMTPVDRTGRGWSGWSMIPLDHSPGSESIELRGRTRDGREASGTRSITIAAKDFPTENLSVSSKYVEPPEAVRKRIERERRKLAEVYARRGAYTPPIEPFLRPVAGIHTSIFGMRRLFNGEPRAPHPGLDLRAEEGTPVYASGPGRVVLAEELYYSGNIVILDHGGGLFTLYAHLSEIRVAADETAKAGDLLGLSGSTGRVTGPHLHWGAKIGNRPFDPEALLDEALF